MDTHYENPDDSRLFAELYDVQPQAIVWLTPIWNESRSAIVDFLFAYCNAEGLNYLNLTREQFNGLRVSTSPTMTDDLRGKFLAELAEVYLTGKNCETSLYNPALNKYARVLRTRLRDGVLSIVQDRTEENRIIRQLELKTAELEDKTRLLESQKSLLDNILLNSSNGISVSRVFRDGNGTVVDAITILANDAAVRFIGLPKEIYLTKRATEIEPTIIGSSYYQMCIRTLETGEPFVMRYQMESTGKWLELTVSKLDIDHLIQIFTDVTPIRETQQALEKAAERLQAVFNASQSGMFTFAPVRSDEGEIIDFRFVISNPAFASYAGQTADVLKDALGSTFFPGYLHNGVFAMYKKTYLTGETLRQDVHYNVDGHDLYLDLLSTKVHDEVPVTFTDYTTLKKAQLQLQTLVEELRRSNTNLEEFAHAASHDLKEPIRKIRVFLDRLEESLAPQMNEKERSLFERIQKAAERMTLLVDDLLTYSSITPTQHEMKAVDLAEKVRTVLADLEVQVEEKKATVNVEPLPVIQGYPRQIQQLFQNLISNALKYSKPDSAPRIEVKHRWVQSKEVSRTLPEKDREKTFHLLSVEDNGIGFDPQQAEQIFQLFYRLHGRTEYAGTGIGLSIARKVVENHNGYIWAEGASGEGATFYMLFPA